jgi:predicted amidohydrolase
LSGYQFVNRMGTDWIVAQPDLWMIQFRRLVARLRLTVFLAHAERDPCTDKLHNTVFVLGPDGGQLGTYRKIQVVPVAETWASAGDAVAPIFVDPLNVGILICADAYSPRLASLLQAQGAELLVSPAAWPPLPHAPEVSWEARTLETGLPLFVCNRGGTDESMCFNNAESAVVVGGKRLLIHSGPHSSVLTVDWDLKAHEPVEHDFRQVRLDDAGAATVDWPRAGGHANKTKSMQSDHSFDGAA